jgi:hypothetical protein
MSYHDHISFDWEEHVEPRFFNRIPKKKVLVWTTGQGEVIRVADMEDSHLQNTINYLTRKSFEWGHAKAKALEVDVDLGEMIVNKMSVDEWLQIFYSEVKRRQDEL